MTDNPRKRYAKTEELQMEKVCDGINHSVKINYVSFIIRPDEVWRKFAKGNLSEIAGQVNQYKQDKSPAVDMFFEYCCDKCEEAIKREERTTMKAINGLGVAPAIGPYSPAIASGDLLFCSGQLGMDPATGDLRDSVAAQTEQALVNLRALLAAAGFGVEHVVKCTIFLASLADFATVNEIYGRTFSEPYPARSTVQVAGLPKGGLVEIEAIAQRVG